MRKNVPVFFVLALAMLLFAFTFSAMAKGGAHVTLSVDKTAFAENDSVTVSVTISNPSKGALRLLKWDTPFEDVEESLFEVTRDGIPVEYIGAHYKRPQPEDGDFIILRSGESFTRTINLADYYDLSVSGSYLVNYNVKSLNLYTPQERVANRQIESLKSDSVNLFIEGRAAKTPEAQAPSAVSGTSSFTKCTATQQSSILTARNDAAVYASDSLSYLNSGATSARYTTWFGAYTSSRYNTVKGNFTNIKNAMDTASMNFDCGCKKRYYAYVYANQPYNIYLCSVYWQAPAKGTDSKAGTLIHETSHFSIVAGTDDWVYGQSGAKNLAISDPNKAVDNADSHEYFAENTPFQP
ncbi:MAG TPA: M35 family metallo-endopeptidase [Pyrinomonadaceae bacterium]|jgi:peptidyl-Lys metalloendopeptidase